MKYSGSPRRLLFVLKEANTQETVGWNLREEVAGGPWASTWNNLTRWTRAIHALPDASAWETLSEIGVDERVETINKIAFMNLNKRTGGRGVANWSAVQTAAHGDSGSSTNSSPSTMRNTSLVAGRVLPISPQRSSSAGDRTGGRPKGVSGSWNYRRAGTWLTTGTPSIAFPPICSASISRMLSERSKPRYTLGLATRKRPVREVGKRSNAPPLPRPSWIPHLGAPSAGARRPSQPRGT